MDPGFIILYVVGFMIWAIIWSLRMNELRHWAYGRRGQKRRVASWMLLLSWAWPVLAVGILVISVWILMKIATGHEEDDGW